MGRGGRGDGGVPSATRAEMSSITSMGWASGLVRGFLSYRQSTSVMRNKRSACTMAAVMAERVSLSPNLISETASVSFSLTMGMTPMSRSSLMVFWALRYLDLCGHVRDVQTQSATGGTYIRDVAPCEKNLGNGLPEMGKEAVPETHQAALSDGSQGLDGVSDGP
jgi:hypothetical protein